MKTDTPLRSGTDAFYNDLAEQFSDCDEPIPPYPTLVSKAALLAEAGEGRPVLADPVQRDHGETPVIRLTLKQAW